MPFDEQQYVQDFVRKMRGRPLTDEDLLPRYAITLPAPDAEIAGQVRAVRAYWNKTYQGNSHLAQVARNCRATDQRLREAHGAAMETRAWWEARQSERQSRAQADITKMADVLRQQYGSLGVVTGGVVDGFAESLSLPAPDAARAVEQAGLRRVAEVTLPESDPIASFPALVKSMQEGGARSVPELVHPGAGEFSLIERYSCLGDPARRLDVAAVERQLAEADKRGTSATDNARRSALKILSRAVKEGADLREIALYHLAGVAGAKAGRSPVLAVDDLAQAGLARADAVVIALTLGERKTAADAAGLTRVRRLLADGRLAEAHQAAQALGAASHRDDALAEVKAARDQLAQLLDQARAAHAARDDSRAVALLREARGISAADADEVLAAIPLAPPAGLTAAGEGPAARLFWQRAPGHDEDTVYVVARTVDRPPAAAPDGTQVHRGPEITCTDDRAPVARAVHYGVFALSDGRPSSPPAVVAITLLPPVSGLAAEVGPDHVDLRWSAHAAAREVRVTRTAAGGRPVPVPVTGSTSHVEGLPDGQAQRFAVTAVYQDAGGTERASPAEYLDATPRAEARPVEKLRARPVEAAGAVRIRVSWTPADSSEVQIRRSGTGPPWHFGQRISPPEMARFGEEVTGRQVRGRSEVAMETEVPAGVHHIVPFSIGGTGIVVGRPVAIGITDPVRHLTATPFAAHATVSWEWPESAQQAEVSWVMGDEADAFTVSQAEYRSGGGVRVPLGASPCAVEVRALLQAGAVSFTSPPERTVIEQVTDVAVAYAISGGPGLGRLGGRAKKVTFTAAEGCDGVQVRLVAAPGRVMPTTAASGIPLLEASLALQPGVPAEHLVNVPKSVKRPYWIRCFVVAGRATLIDPPIASLKEA
jgi:hypothetical protein